ncbi:hypothetical protein F442_03951 [Phytophthora nicotianae P10297]|uniref:Uncharacterized protein n=1 Tax=Phytophthora nicotianae P10297 TaxID=1317064 RepID=W2ZV08_PHYNI|nr:hypothetical protein F442_03951 [Phytophthora nicotianae P10297]
MVPTRYDKQRAASANLGNTKKQKISNAPGNLLYMVLDFGSSIVWNYLGVEGVSNLLKVCSYRISGDFAHNMALNAIGKFCTENKVHLGLGCGCDWMRSLDFVPRSDDTCVQSVPFSVDMNLTILRIPGGAQALLNALVIALKLKKLIPTYPLRGAARFVPVICPLITKENKLCPCSQRDLTRAMNGICQTAGTHYFHDYKRGRGRTIPDYLAQHWNGMEGTSCQYCNNLTEPQKNFMAHCTDVYRPIKAGLKANLQFVRFVPRRRGLYGLPSELRLGGMYDPYEGLAAGITADGILCGFYQKDGFKGHYY